MECIELYDWECQLVRANGSPHCVLLPLAALSQVADIDPFSLYHARLTDGDLTFISNAGKLVLKGCPADVRHMLLSEVPLFIEVEPNRGVVLFATKGRGEPSRCREPFREIAVREVNARRSTTGISHIVAPVLATFSLQYALIIPTIYSLDLLLSARPAIEASLPVAVGGIAAIATAHLIRPVHLWASQASFAVGITAIFTPVLISLGTISASNLMQAVFMGSVFGLGFSAALRLAAVTLPSPAPERFTVRGGRHRKPGKSNALARLWPFRVQRPAPACGN